MYKYRRIACLLTALACLSCLPTSVRSADEAGSGESIISIRTSQLKGMISGTSMNPLTRVAVSYKLNAADSRYQPYEIFWYHKGKALGFERSSELALQGRAVALVVTHQGSPDPESDMAAANTILRMVLESLNARNGLMYIKLPDASFSSIIQALYKMGLADSRTPADQTSKAKLILSFVSADPQGPKKQLAYY